MATLIVIIGAVLFALCALAGLVKDHPANKPEGGEQ